MTEGIVKTEGSMIPQKVEANKEVVKKFSNEFDVAPMLATAGALKLSKEEMEKLYDPMKDEDIEIRPDGLIYAPWMNYATRLREVFGAEWAMIPNGMFEMANNHVYWGFWLIVRGHLVSYALGDQEWSPTNYTMSKSDAVEGAWSNALMRNCKHIGISLELWKPSFIKEWINKYAEKYHDSRKNKDLWRRKGPAASSAPHQGPIEVEDIVEDGEGSDAPPEAENRALGSEFATILTTTTNAKADDPIANKWWDGKKLVSEAQVRLLYAKMKSKGIPHDKFKDFFKVDDFKHLPSECMNDALLFISKTPAWEGA